MAQLSMSKLAKVPESLRNSIACTKATYRQLGRSGLRVSNPILGCLHMGKSDWLPWVLDEDKSLDLLKAAYDRGINTWDTANVYSNGESERIIGKALQKYCIPRRKVVIMTKCYRVLCDSENYDASSSVTMHHNLADLSKDYVNQWGLSRSAIFEAVEASLKRLGTTYIDVLQIHRYDETVSPEETMSALNDLVRSGLVRYIGASSMWTYQFAILQTIAEKNGWVKFISMQNHYNLLYREEEREMNKYCGITGVGLIPWAPLAHGRLARPPSFLSTRSSSSQNGSLYIGSDDHSSKKIVSRVQEIAESRGWPMSHVALAWLNKRTTAPVMGINSIERMDEILDVRDKKLSDDEDHYLEQPYIPQIIQGHS